ncbi:class F sortase [Candidatus Saccharibacteria bacterium]|nr:class F sortase [Candidatus Saccharibacteria bacterium]
MTILVMSLKIKSWRNLIKCIVWGVIAIVFLIFLIRVIVFENNYYNEKEGSERAVVEEVEEKEYEEELIEEEPTENEVREYTVAADRPRYLTISKLGIYNARILPMGVNSKGELSTPNNIFDVGWYEGSEKPGEGGTMVIDGHNGGPNRLGVFKNLPDLDTGDIIQVERGDGEIFQYSVVENNSMSLEDADAYMRVAVESPEDGKESVTLISCTGEWSQQQKTYLSRQFTRAVLVQD